MDSNHASDGLMGSVLPVLAISGAGAATIKTTNAYKIKINGAISAISAATLAAIPATITVPLLSTSSVAVYVNAAGTASYVQGQTVLTSSLPANTIYNTGFLPTAEASKALALIGYMIISTASTVTFTGGTTLLDAANLTVTYMDVLAVTN